jgi:UPF0755 protein
VRVLKFLFAVGGLAIAFGGVVFAFLLIVSGGNVREYVRESYTRIMLASRREELDQPAGTDDTALMFLIESGDTPRTIARNLHDNGLIIEEELFIDYVIAENIDRRLEAGAYFLNQTQTIPEIAHQLTDSRNSSILFRVIEGWRLEEIAISIDSNPRFQFTGEDFLDVTQTGNQIDPVIAESLGIPAGATLEGFMYPDIYQLPPNITAVDLRDTLLERFMTQVDAQMIRDARDAGFTMRDVVTLASIVEREAVWDDENDRIASVYRNRLDTGMRLDADPTVQYALNDTRGSWWGRITQADYGGVQSPYNTYLNFGLPPSPIANPNIESIRAVIYPENTAYLFFRAMCDGSNYHNFAETYEEHLANGC